MFPRNNKNQRKWKEEQVLNKAWTKRNLRVFKTNKKTSRKLALQQESHQKNNWHLCKILGIILEIDEGRGSTNKLNDKKADDDAQGLTSERP